MKTILGLAGLAALAAVYFRSSRESGVILPELPRAESQSLRDAPNDGSSDDLPDVSSIRNLRGMSQKPAGDQTGNAASPDESAPAATGAEPAAGECLADPPPVEGSDAGQRVEKRNYPSVFQAWQPVSGESGQHDLIWRGPEAFGLVGKCPEFPSYTNPKTGACLYPGLVSEFDASRANFSPKGPDTVVLVEIGWHDRSFVPPYFPAGPAWQKGHDGPNGDMRKADSTLSSPMYFLDYSNPCVQKRIVLRCQAAVKAGVDGCFFDWWHPEDRSLDGAAMTVLLRRVRKAIGNALILVNANGSTPSDIADANGVYMEGFGAKFWGPGGQGGENGQGDVPPYPVPAHWQYLIQHLKDVNAAETRTPQLNAVEGWGDPPGGPKYDPRYLRALTSVVLIYSNDYVLYARPNKYVVNHDHTHTWDPFWNPDLGSPSESRPPETPRSVPGTTAVYREFSNGIVVYNPLPSTGSSPAEPASLPESFLRRYGLKRSHRLDGDLPPGPLTIESGDGDILVR